MDSLLMYEGLHYEDPLPEELKDPVPPLFNTPMCEAVLENGVECPNEATAEFVAHDEDGDGYYTYRCDDHPEEDPEYNRREL